MNENIQTVTPPAAVKEPFRISPIWIVPVLAAVATAWLVINQIRHSGPLVTITFQNGDGLQANQTVVKYRGVEIGAVKSVELSEDAQHVAVRARLNRSAKDLAREGSVFWIVRPEVGANGLKGLETIISGPYIQVEPGQGNPARKFTGSETAPPETRGKFEIVLSAPELGSISAGSPVYYRGMEVGSVNYYVLGHNSKKVEIHAFIDNSYAPLIRKNTKFWNAGGVNINLKFFAVDISAESFKSLVIGGIAFATPDPPGPQTGSGSIFELADKVHDDWLDWSPSITVTNPRQENTGEPSSELLNNVKRLPKQ